MPSPEEKKEETTFLYFAYGSNMSLQRLRATGRAPSAERLVPAHIAGCRLVFDKVSRDGSGKADCERTGVADDVVHGGLFRIAQCERAALDLVEGVGHGYEPAEIEVDTEAGPVRALTYLATLKDPARRPYAWYMRHVLVGARELGLPLAYIVVIERALTIPDPDMRREAWELAIYAPR